MMSLGVRGDGRKQKHFRQRFGAGGEHYRGRRTCVGHGTGESTRRIVLTVAFVAFLL
jgi:hypothetical protein